MQQQHLTPELSSDLQTLWSRWSDLDPAHVERLIAQADALARSDADAPEQRAA